MRSGKQGRKIGDAGCIAEKRENMAVNRSKKLISSKAKAQTSAIFLSICIEPANHGKYLLARFWLGGKKHATYRCYRCFGLSPRQTGKFLLKFSDQHNSEQNKL